MTEEFEVKERDPKEVFRNVVTLYSVLQGRRQHLRVRRAALNLRGEVRAEAIDFLADVELKARRVLSPQEFKAFLERVHTETTDKTPVSIQMLLGELWNRYDLNFDGPYGSLYFMIRNEQEKREAIEAENNEPID